MVHVLGLGGAIGVLLGAAVVLDLTTDAFITTSGTLYGMHASSHGGDPVSRVIFGVKLQVEGCVVGLPCGVCGGSLPFLLCENILR